MVYRDYVGDILGYIGGLYWDKGKENENYKVYRDYIGIILGYWKRKWKLLNSPQRLSYGKDKLPEP